MYKYSGLTCEAKDCLCITNCMLITSCYLSLISLINTDFMSNILEAPSVYLLTEINVIHSKSLAI